MPLGDPAPTPPSLLGYHRPLAPSAAVKVSPLCLGAMNFGSAWRERIGDCTKEQAFEILDRFYGLGGNFIDTCVPSIPSSLRKELMNSANNYQDGESEQWLGEWMKARGNRDQIVLATKYSGNFAPPSTPIRTNTVGNSLKSLRQSTAHSLTNLQTPYIDLLYLHYWDFTTSIPEVMHALNDLITAGKVLYLGVSDTPAWVVVKANEYARTHGLRPFSVYQGKWNMGCRDVEREVLPMCRDQGMGVVPWGVMGVSKFRTAERRETVREEDDGRKVPLSENDVKLSEALEAMAVKKKVPFHALCLAYILHKAPYTTPLVAQRKPEHLLSNLTALSVRLTPDEIRHLESIIPFDIGFPMNFIFGGHAGVDYSTELTAGDVYWTTRAAWIDVPPHQRPIAPRVD